jgi:hypothetical protein
MIDIVEPLADDLTLLRPARPARDALFVANAAGGFVDLHNWRRRVWKAAFPGSSPYDGRHTYASLLIHEGGSLPYVTAFLGHPTAKTTLDHYAHVYSEAQLGTAVKMEDAITNARRAVRKSYASPPRRPDRRPPRTPKPRYLCGVPGSGRYWARTSDPQLVELVLSQLS